MAGLSISDKGWQLRPKDHDSIAVHLSQEDNMNYTVKDTLSIEVAPAKSGLIQKRRVKVNLLRDRIGLYIKTVVNGSGHAAESVITDLHDNIVSLSIPRIRIPGGGKFKVVIIALAIVAMA